MKTLLRTSVAVAALATSAAFAADLPRREAPVAPIYAAPIFTWAGFYVGLNAGAGFATNNNNGGSNLFILPGGSVLGSPGTNGVLTVGNNNSNNRTGFVGGGQVGYNFQFGNFVAGVEADIQYSDRNRRNGTVTPFPGYTFVGAPGLAFAPPPATVVTGFGSNNQNFFGTVRGRLGYAFDRALIYGTAGLAYSGSNSRVGYAVGGGAEYAITNNFSLKLEGLYVDIRRSNSTFGTSFNLATNTIFVGDGARRRNEFFVVRAGVNYRFGQPAGPVFAKY